MSRLTGPIVQPAKRTRCYATAMSAITFSLMTRRGRPSKRSRVKQVRAFRNWRALQCRHAREARSACRLQSSARSKRDFT
jgi:hypothetical protein